MSDELVDEGSLDPLGHEAKKCIYCHVFYDPTTTLGQWGCRFHPLANWGCCSLDPGDLLSGGGRNLSRFGGAGRGWPIEEDIYGCTRCDHTTRPWTTADQTTVLHLGYRDATRQETYRPGRSTPIDTLASLQAFVRSVLVARDATLRALVSATLTDMVVATSQALLEDNWHDALVKDAPRFFRALALNHASLQTPELRGYWTTLGTFERVRAAAVDMHQSIKHLLTRPLHLALPTPMDALGNAKPMAGQPLPYGLLAEALAWIAKEADNVQANGEDVMSAWETCVMHDLTPMLIPFYSVRRFAPEPDGSVLRRSRGIYKNNF